MFRAVNIDTLTGAPVPALRPGNYTATLVLTDANSDVRFGQIRFVEEPGLRGGPKANVWCERLGRRHLRIHCIVTFNNAGTKGRVQVRLTRGGHTVARGRARVRQGDAFLTMHQLRRVKRGAWRMIMELAGPNKSPQRIVVTPTGML